MKIWVDFINSPQVSFLTPLINELIEEGNELVITCRDSANTVELIKQRGWSYTIIGDRVYRSTTRKALSFPARILKLISFLKKKNIAVSICQSSFYLPLTSKILGIPSIYTNDNEHALGNIPSFLSATKILIPETFPDTKILKLETGRNKVLKYPGVKEGVYLWSIGERIQRNRKAGRIPQKTIYVRPEPLTAQYYSGHTDFLDRLLIDLKGKYPVVVLTREKSQADHYTKNIFEGIIVPDHPLPFEDVAEKCLLFIGAGGSMTREMALMGIPTVSIYQGELLEVDKFLLSQKLMVHRKSLEFKDVMALLNTKARQTVNMNLIMKGQEAAQLFKQEVLKYEMD